MKVAVLVTNPEFLKSIEQISKIEMKSINHIDELDVNEVEAFIFEQSFVSSIQVISIRDKSESVKLVMVHKDLLNDQIKTFVAHDVKLISENETSENIKKVINEQLFDVSVNNRLSNVLAISGSHPQVGITQTALSIASAVHEYDKSVGVLGLNPYNPGFLTTINGKDTLDQVYGMIKNDILTSKKLLSLMLDADGVSYLLGNDDVLKTIEYELEPIEKLIQIASETFDVVILDLGSLYDNALTIAGLKMANTHVLLATQQDVSSLMFQKWKEKILLPLDIIPEDSVVVVNKFRDDLIKTMSQLNKDFNMPIMGKIPYMIGAIDEESDLGLLYKSSDKTYQKSIKKITKGLFNDFKSNLNDQRPKKKKSFMAIFN